MKTEQCSNCIFYRRLKHNFTPKKGFEESNCCVVWIKTDDDDNAWVQEVDARGMCELFTPKNEAYADKSGMEFADQPTLDYGA